MKNIDVKSLIIGALLTSTIFLGVAAAGKGGMWDKKQEWLITMGDPSHRNLQEFPKLAEIYRKASKGAEPFAVQGKNIIFRKRIK